MSQVPPLCRPVRLPKTAACATPPCPRRAVGRRAAAAPARVGVVRLPARWRGLYAALNPAVGLVDTFRRVLASGVPPDPFLLGVSTAGAGVLAWAGYRLFKRLEPAFADVL